MGLVQDIKAQEWTFAKTYAATAPHEYFLYHQNPALYEALVKKIEKSGVSERFYKRNYLYLYLGKYKYWYIGTVMNRSLIKGYTEKQKEELLNA